ncbi:MAG: nickel/cobalt transporter [Inquilinaceae bacterium]
MRVILPISALAIGVAVLAGVAAAASPIAGQAGPDPSLWARGIAWVLEQQRLLHAELATGLRGLEGGGGAAAWGLVLTGFLYGVFHAAGPGHGKAVIATYLVAEKQSIRRGVGLVAAASVLQGVVAVTLVYGFIYLAGWLPRDTAAAVGWSERVSFVLVVAIGAALVVRAMRRVGPLVRRMVSSNAAVAAGASGVDVSGHDHAHAACGHAHVPTADQIDRARDLRTSVGAVLSIGLRPCTGAVLVLVLARVAGLPWAGVGAVAAMSAGTAVAVGVLAVLVVALRDRAAALVPGHQTRWQMSAGVVTLAGGAVLMALGGSLLAASFAPSHPLGL